MLRSLHSVTLLLPLVFTSAVVAEETSNWTFTSDDNGWTGNAQAELSIAGGNLKIVSRGNDPYFSAAAKAPEGWNLLTISAQFKGKADVQIFWTTEKDGATSERNSVQSEFRGNPDSFERLQMYFQTDSPLTSIRIDPFSRKGTILIKSITLTDEAPPVPEATPVESIKVAKGFRVEMLHSVREEDYGSWVSMTEDASGRLIVSDQYGKLYRVTPPSIGTDEKIQIETIDLDIGMAQGLLYAFDSLYVMVNGTDAEKQGLYRVTDTDADDKFDKVEWLRQIDGGGEHGPHAVILSPDGASLYVCAGNHTNPTEFSTSRVPRVWQEDQLLPRMWDAGGHAVGKMAPGGWVAKVSPDGKDWELVASGFRNEYDIAFSAEGDLFTYDADMEWDVGTPWYRPTRVNHVTSGAEFGWRSGTGKWPAWYPDSLPSVIDIGPGSPTGIAFGTGARFPEKYQRALFISDWSYGVIYAVSLTPDGSTWSGNAEPFVSAAPLPATDLLIGKDGALYFTIGGRRTQSGLYRVTYVGDESTARVSTPVDQGADLRRVRRELEALHTSDAEDVVDKAWPLLAHSDRHIRFAARIALEHQPVETWDERALAEETNADSKITALLALVRHADPELQIRILRSLGKIATLNPDEEQVLGAFRVVQLALIRLGRPDPEVTIPVAAVLSPLYPASSTRLNHELCALLVYLGHEDVARKTLQLMRDAPTQEEQLWYALCLRALNDNWTTETRTEYFNWFLNASKMRGGHSFSLFLKNIRQEAIDAMSDAERETLKDLLAKQPAQEEPTIESASRPFVSDWTVEDLMGVVQPGLKNRDFNNGQKMFTVTACFKCHRFAGRGGIVGPDLTAVGRRFNARNLLESLIEPSKVISDQYEASVFLTDKGKQIMGRVVNLNRDIIMVSENMLDPGNLTQIKRDEVEEHFVSKTSMMPKGLLNNLTKDEILDLMAFLQSGGNAADAVFSGN